MALKKSNSVNFEGGAMRGRREVMRQPAGTMRRREGARREATQPPSIPVPNGSDWKGGSHGCSLY